MTTPDNRPTNGNYDESPWGTSLKEKLEQLVRAVTEPWSDSGLKESDLNALSLSETAKEEDYIG